MAARADLSAIIVGGTGTGRGGYRQLLHVGDDGGVSGSLVTVYDGDGTATDLQLSSGAVNVLTSLSTVILSLEETFEPIVMVLPFTLTFPAIINSSAFLLEQ